MFRHFWSQIAVVQEAREPLPRCDMCGIHVPAGRLIKHRQMERCNRNTHMRWWRRDVEIEAKCSGATLGLALDDRAECFEGVDAFKYLGWVLHQTDNDWPALLCNIRRASQVCGRLGKLLRRKCTYPITSEKIYWSVVQAVLLLVAETWLMLAATLNKIEGYTRDFCNK